MVMNGQNCFDVQKEFFVIDSDKLEQVETKLYGFAIVDNVLVESTESLQYAGMEGLTGDGAYVYVHRTSEKITIKQDYVGSYGLYLYRDGDYFALSNSFIMLVDYVKKNHRITFNHDYATYFLLNDLCSLAYSETMVNEIEILDRSVIVDIDINIEGINIVKYDYEENTIELNSQEGIEILDRWYQKWTALIRNLRAGNSNMQIDLSGGFDSRMTLALLIGSGIDLNDIFINSYEDGLHTHSEDYEVASLIGNHFGFKLNNRSNLSEKFFNYSLDDIINLSFYTKLGFHKQMYLKYNHNVSNRHCFGGAGGECVRSYWNMSKEEYIEKEVRRCKKFSGENAQLFEKAVRKILNDSFNQIQKKFEGFGRALDPEDMTLNLYRETRCRHHFGKDVVENHHAGYLKYSPLLDCELHKLKLNDNNCRDKNLLMAVILNRYVKELLNFKFEGDRSINELTIEYAKKINAEYPFEYKETLNRGDCVTGQKKEESFLFANNNQRVGKKVANKFIENAFESPKVKKIFSFLYDEEVYKYVSDSIAARNYFPLLNAYSVLAATKVFEDVMANETMLQSSIADYMNGQSAYIEFVDSSVSELQYHAYLDNYITARIDIKNMEGDANDIEFVDISDKRAKITAPEWFAKNGKGYLIESKNGKLNLEFRCIKSGQLTIALKARDVRDMNNSRIPFWVDYYAMRINDQNIFDEVHPISHDAPYKYNCQVSDGDVVRLSVEWNPHDEKNYRVN